MNALQNIIDQFHPLPVHPGFGSEFGRRSNRNHDARCDNLLPLLQRTTETAGWSRIKISKWKARHFSQTRAFAHTWMLGSDDWQDTSTPKQFNYDIKSLLSDVCNVQWTSNSESIHTELCWLKYAVSRLHKLRWTGAQHRGNESWCSRKLRARIASQKFLLDMTFHWLTATQYRMHFAARSQQLRVEFSPALPEMVMTYCAVFRNYELPSFKLEFHTRTVLQRAILVWENSLSQICCQFIWGWASRPQTQFWHFLFLPRLLLGITLDVLLFAASSRSTACKSWIDVWDDTH